MWRQLLVLVGAAACNRVFGIEETGNLPPGDATIAPDGDPRVDLDRDNIKDVEDPCIAPTTDLAVDTDGDGLANGIDSCPLDKDPMADADGDGIGDGCDPTHDGEDRLRCVMAFTDPDLDVEMWRARGEPTAWTVHNPRVLVGSMQGAILADWSFEAPEVTTIDTVGYLYTSGAVQTSQFDMFARAGRDPGVPDVGCSLVTGPSWQLVSSDGTSALLGPPAASGIVTRFRMSVTVVPRAADGRTVRCSARFDGGPTATVDAPGPLPVGTLGFGTSGISGIYGIVVYERDNAPP